MQIAFRDKTMSQSTRRFFLTTVAKFVAGGTLLSACSTVSNTANQSIDVSFRESVASGDPLADRVIIWTRITPLLRGENKSLVTVSNIVWQLALDADFRSIAKQGSTSTSDANDFCVKVDATGLQANTKYYYRFIVGDNSSPIGRTKTLPLNQTEEARFAVVSCSNYGHGYFHAYANIAKRGDLDFVLHLGDYIYEYQDDVYTDPELIATTRALEPKHEILSLDDYRARYRCYRSDKDLQAVHANHAFIVVWDDHELANDAWIDGAQGHQSNEGDWNERKRNALKAYREYMPIRDPEQEADSLQIYRQFDIGNLASLIMLDTRLIGREEQLDYRKENIDQTQLQDSERDLLGPEQETWLNHKLRESKAAGQPWQIIGQQLLTGRVSMPDVSDIIAPDNQSQEKTMNGIIRIGEQGMPMNLDAWDGYNAAKQRVLQSYKTAANNVISLAGDTHNSWAFELTPDSEERPVAVEFGTPSVSSPGMESWFPTTDHHEAAKRMVQKNRELVYHDNAQRGWLEVRLKPQYATSQFHFIDDVKTTTYSIKQGPIFRTNAGEHRVIAKT